jgi:small membrane protein
VTYIWIQLLLMAGTGVLVLAFVRRWDAAHTRAWKRLAFFAFVVANVYAVLRPQDVTWVANRLGVGRGTDLVLYLLVVAMAFMTLNTFMRFRSLEKKLTDLARTVAVNDGQRVNNDRFGEEPVPIGSSDTTK